MATIEIIIRDDHGNIIEGRARKEYKLDLGNQSCNAIEAAVGTFKHIALPDLQADLLKEAQDNFIKKRPMKAKWHKSSSD
jgi:hypothetical protein